MSNLQIYEKVKQVPTNAMKEIKGGRLKGMTDINPMWRLKALTEQFGPCGVGWTYEITSKHLEKGAGDEIAAFVDINLYIKYNGEWSQAIPGTGGNLFVTQEQRGLHTNDECYKMALTDAISVAAKALGFGADVYWDKDKTKYNGKENEPTKPQEDTKPKTQPQQQLDQGKVQRLAILRREKGITEEQHKAFLDKARVTTSKSLTEEQYKKYVEWLEKQPSIEKREEQEATV